MKSARKGNRLTPRAEAETPGNLDAECATEPDQSLSVQEERFVTFLLGEEIYCLDIAKVSEIISLTNISPVPGTPEFVRGMTNLRGKIVPVVDLRARFGMEEVRQSDRTCIIVAQLNSDQMGIVVDRVSEVVSLAVEGIEDLPNLGADVSAEFISGVGKRAGKVLLVLDIDRALCFAERTDLQSLAA